MKDIQETAGILESHANAGTMRCNQQASVPELGEVWFGHDAIANIFGFADLVKTHHITHNLDIENAFLVHMGNKAVKFEANLEGLYQLKVPETYPKPLKKQKLNKYDTNCRRKQNVHFTTSGTRKFSHKVIPYHYVTIN